MVLDLEGRGFIPGDVSVTKSLLWTWLTGVVGAGKPSWGAGSRRGEPSTSQKNEVGLQAGC